MENCVHGRTVARLSFGSLVKIFECFGRDYVGDKCLDVFGLEAAPSKGGALSAKLGGSRARTDLPSLSHAIADMISCGTPTRCANR